uniref:thiol oxidase n=1 Tax=viral metagenome TaxID=1070528 RepID=A0A6C0CNG0_9ZZZZ
MNKISNKTLKKKQKQKQKQISFKEIHYKSNDGMLTTVWGPPMWHYLHTMSFNYPVKPTKRDKTNYRNVILNLQNTLPCGKCRENLKSNFEKLPITMKTMKNRETFSRYIFDLHELINTMLNKRSGLTYDEVRYRYELFRSRCGKTKKKIVKEKGCTEPIVGEKSKCVLHIVPRDKVCDSLKIDKQCEKVKVV